MTYDDFWPPAARKHSAKSLSHPPSPPWNSPCIPSRLSQRCEHLPVSCPLFFGGAHGHAGLRVLTESINMAHDKVDKGGELDGWSELRCVLLSCCSFVVGGAVGVRGTRKRRCVRYLLRGVDRRCGNASRFCPIFFLSRTCVFVSSPYLFLFFCIFRVFFGFSCPKAVTAFL